MDGGTAVSSSNEEICRLLLGVWECGRWEEYYRPLDANDAATTLPDTRVPNDNGRIYFTDSGAD